MQTKLSVSIGKLKLKNPVTVASGTFGYAEEFGDFMNLKELGAIVTKTVTLKPRQGNPAPRTCEAPAGMLNSIGLENPGVEFFIRERLPALSKIGIPVIVSIGSEEGLREFAPLARRLNKIEGVAAIELNISCPNIRGNPRLISQDPRATFEAVRQTRTVTRKTIIAKLSPNVTDITEIAAAAERGGADAVSLINTITALAVDVKTRQPKIACVTAGLSGPAVRPVAVRMVWEVYRKIKIPIIGMGGIIDASSALEFIIAGASAVSVGTANFINPGVSIEIIQGVENYLKQNKIKDIKSLIGSLKI